MAYRCSAVAHARPVDAESEDETDYWLCHPLPDGGIVEIHPAGVDENPHDRAKEHNDDADSDYSDGM